MGEKPLMNKARSLKSAISGTLVAVLVAGMGAIGAAPVQANPATVNVTVSCAANTSVIANPGDIFSNISGDTLVFSFGTGCSSNSQFFNWRNTSSAGFLATTFPTVSSGSVSSMAAGGWYVNGSFNKTVSSEFAGNNGSSPVAIGDTIAMVLVDSTAGSPVFFRVIWQGAPSPTPTISTQPASTSKTVGDALSLSVSATRSGAGLLTYQWKKDGTSLSGKTSATLSIPSVVLGDAGSYTVDVTNTESPYTPTTVTSSAAVVTVTAAAPSSSTPSSSTPSSSTPTSSATVASTGQTFKGKPIEFSLGTSTITSDAKKNLKDSVAAAGKSAKYTITGTAGKKSGVSDKAVKALAKKRANILKAYLVKLGVSKSSITIKTKVVKQGKKPKASVLALY